MSVMKKIAAAALLAVGITAAPLAHADSGDQSEATQAVETVYVQRQQLCTPSLTPQFQKIVWDNFTPASWGAGRIVDANSHLGGPFKVYYANPRVGSASAFPGAIAVGQWAVVLEFC